MASSAPNIYDLDPAARQLLQVDTFRSKFVVNEFVQQLNASNIASSTSRKSLSEALDPKPYIRTFEAALSRLHDLRMTVDHQSKEMEQTVSEAEAQFSRRNTRLGGTFRDINSTFTDLQNRISEVGKTVVTVGIECLLRSTDPRWPTRSIGKTTTAGA
jgi:exocyst complex component 5